MNRPVITRPHDWIFAIALPESEAEYRTQFGAPERFDFIHRIPGGWRVYERSLLRQIRDSVAYYRSLGVIVELNFTFAAFKELAWQSGPNKAVTLVAHWTSAGVEFVDGIAPFDAIAKAVPETYNGIIDLCVCHPAPLVVALRQERPAIRAIRFIDAPASLLLWLRLYKALFATLATEELDAYGALQGWSSAIVDRVTKGKGREWAVKS
ncbi:hypothetical protein [Novosphingobium terrae]|uniref:hypothetical protein n=1 Tax=Novosphingobium terrae TaxID=2726189 RepID=UPI001980BBFB|nr:hypothetical protein [Novosphingobium terrae]